MQWSIYLSGEIHTDWRDEIARGAGDAGLPVVFTSAVTDHAAPLAATGIAAANAASCPTR